MAKVLILSSNGDGISIALRLAQEGHLVKVWSRGGKVMLNGYTNPSPTSSLDGKYDLTISDMVGMGLTCNFLKKQGQLVLGGSTFHDRLELDRLYGVKVVKQLTKLHVPETIHITDKETLKKELQKANSARVIKPLNNKSVDLTLVSSRKDNKALLSIINQWGEKLTPCLLQEKIPEEVEISTEGWFNGEEFVLPFNHTFEKKRLMEGDKGPQTGCMGNVVYPTEGDKLTDLALKPLTPFLKKINYVGPIDVNCIISKGKAYFLEFTTRFGYDAIQAWMELFKLSLFDYLYHIATGQGNLKKHTDYRNEMSIAVRLSMNPYPSKEGIKKWRGIQVVNVLKEAEHHIWLMDVMKLRGVPVLAGTDGVVGCVAARGISPQECRRRVYRSVENLIIHPDVQYRTDIGRDVYFLRNKFDEWCRD